MTNGNKHRPVQRLRVHVWELPVRLTHWINALCILILMVTGFYIGNPFIHAISSKQYIMGWVRFIHFIVAYTFMMSIIIRIYWAFMGNKYANYKEFFPFSEKRFKNLLHGIKFYLYLRKEPPHSVGHVPLAGVTYLLVISISIFQIISGFAMYSVNHSGAIWTVLGGWLLGIMHLQTIRLFHHLLMYVLLAYAFVHIYLLWYLDIIERNGLMGSMFSGNKFLMIKEIEEESRNRV